MTQPSTRNTTLPIRRIAIRLGCTLLLATAAASAQARTPEQAYDLWARALVNFDYDAMRRLYDVLPAEGPYAPRAPLVSEQEWRAMAEFPSEQQWLANEEPSPETLADARKRYALYAALEQARRDAQCTATSSRIRDVDESRVATVAFACTIAALAPTREARRLCSLNPDESRERLITVYTRALRSRAATRLISGEVELREVGPAEWGGDQVIAIRDAVRAAIDDPCKAIGSN